MGIGYCARAGEYFIIFALVFVVVGIISDLLNLKLGLGSTSWLLIAVALAVGSTVLHMHAIMAKHLLGMEVMKKD